MVSDIEAEPEAAVPEEASPIPDDARRSIAPTEGGSRTHKVTVRITEGLSRRWTHRDITEVRTSLAAGTAIEDVAQALGRDVVEVATLARQFRMKGA